MFGVVAGGAIAIFGQWLVDRRSQDNASRGHYSERANRLISELRARQHCLSSALTTSSIESRGFCEKLEREHSLSMLALELNSSFPQLMDCAKNYFDLGFEGLRVAGVVAAEQIRFADIPENQRRMLVEAIVVAERPLLAALAEISYQMAPRKPRTFSIETVLKKARDQMPKSKSGSDP